MLKLKELSPSLKSKLQKTVRINLIALFIYSGVLSIFMFIVTFSDSDQFSNKNLGDWFFFIVISFFIQFMINFIKCIVFFAKKNYELGKVYLFMIALQFVIFTIAGFSFMIATVN